MLISSLLNLIYLVLSALLVFELPQLPDSVLTIAVNVKGRMLTGIDILRTFVGNTCMGVIAVLLTLVIAMNGAYFLYSLVMWVLRKIPFLNLKE